MTAVPVSAFYESSDIKYFARFAFCKEEAAIDEAISRLKAHFGTRGA